MTPEQREQWAQQWQREMGKDSERDQLSNQLQEVFSNPQASAANGHAREDDRNNSPYQGDPPMDLASAAKEDVDLRGESPGEQVLAQWLGEAGDVSSDATRTTTATQRVEQARNAAQRAVDDAAVPSRYHSLIKRIFGRLDETTRNATGTTGSTPTHNDQSEKTPGAGSGESGGGK
jgi:hypothetical protein